MSATERQAMNTHLAARRLYTQARAGGGAGCRRPCAQAPAAERGACGRRSRPRPPALWPICRRPRRPTSAATQGSVRSCRRPPAATREAASAARRRANASAFRRVALLPCAAACCPQAAAAPRFAPPSLPLLPRTCRATNAAIVSTFTLDLHYQHVEEALASLERCAAGCGCATCMAPPTWHAATAAAAGCCCAGAQLTHTTHPASLSWCRYLVTLGGLGHPGGVVLQVTTGVGRHRCAGVQSRAGRCASAAHRPPPVPCSSPTAALTCLLPLSLSAAWATSRACCPRWCATYRTQATSSIRRRPTRAPSM